MVVDTSHISCGCELYDLEILYSFLFEIIILCHLYIVTCCGFWNWMSYIASLRTGELQVGTWTLAYLPMAALVSGLYTWACIIFLHLALVSVLTVAHTSD